jgi:hypothetical protein
MRKLVALSFSLFLILSSAYADTVQTNAVMHRRLIWTEQPQTSAIICWDTATEGTNHRVYMDTESRKAVLKDYKSNQVCTANGSYTWTPPKKKGEANSSPSKPDLYYHHAQLTGLKPATTYYFVMASGDTISEEYHFKTAPATDEPMKLIFGADSRTGIAARRKLNVLIAKMVEEDQTIIAFAHGGDYVVNGSDLEGWKSWLADHELTITASHRMIPLIPARGNHESKGPLYDQVLGFPGGAGKNYFATQLCPQILFVTLNTEIPPDGAQKTFLEASLAAASTIRWRVTQYHRPVYPAVKKEPDAGLEHWVPLFDKYNLALACEADGHCIKRTLPIRNGKPDATGVIYIGEGGMGAEQRTPNADLWYLKSPGMASKGDHFQLLSFTKSHLGIDVVDNGGKIIDTYKIEARGTN